MTEERITPSAMDPGAEALVEHLDRYRLAASLLRPTDRVVDASCGVGYGSALLGERAAHVVGLDIDPEAIDHARADYAGRTVEFAVADLEADPIPDCDVLVTFETIEHLRDPAAFLARCRQRARRLVLVSTPVTPTTHRNQYHLHDLTTGLVEDWMSDWHRAYALLQSGADRVVYGVWVFSPAPLGADETHALLALNLDDQRRQFWRHQAVLESLAAWTAELDRGKRWLEEHEGALGAELAQVTRDKQWLEGQLAGEQQVIAELRGWAAQLEEGKAWLESQWHASQAEAERRRMEVDDLRAELDRLASARARRK